MPLLDLRLFGAPLLTIDQQPITLTRRQPLALLAYLALAESAVSRDRLAFLLWPDEPQTIARNRLRMSLSQLRSALAERGMGHVLVTAGEAVQLDFRLCRVDVREFLDLVAQCQSLTGERLPLLAEKATACYQGVLLEGFSLHEATEFEAWMGQTRQHLERLYRRLLEKLIDASASNNRERAIAYAEQLTLLDPLDEENHCKLLALYASNGQRGAVVRQFDTFTTTLQRELGVDPLPATRSLYQSLLQDQPPVPTIAANPAPLLPTAQAAWQLRNTLKLPLIGRTEEVATARGWLTEALVGNALILCLSGVAGSGKTRLLHAVTSSFAYPLWLGSGQRVAQAMPYLAILRALRSGLAALPTAQNGPALQTLPDLWLAEASRLLPELRLLRPDLHPPPDLPPSQAQARLFEALTRLAVTLAQAQGGALLVIDDLHDADEGSLGWLINLARHLRSQRAPLAIAVAYQADEPRPALLQWLEQVTHDGLCQNIRLAPLTVQAVQQMVRSADGSLTETAVETIAQRIGQYSEGYPFVVLELLRALLQSQDLVGMARLGPSPTESAKPLPIPDTVRNLIIARLQTLDPIAAQIFDACVVAQDALAMEEVQQIAGRDELETALALDSLVETQLLTTQNNCYLVSQAIVRDVAYGQIGAARCRLLHRRAATALQARPQGAGLAALHFAQARLPMEAAQCYLRAARLSWAIFATQATLTALDCATSLLSSLQASEAEPLLFDLLLLREDLLHSLGKRAEQSELLDQLVQVAADLELTQQASAAQRRGRYLLALNRWQEAETVLQQACQAFDEVHDPSSLDVALLLARAQAQQQRYDEARSTAQNTHQHAQQRRKRKSEIDSLITLAEIEQSCENFAAAAQFLHEAQRLGWRHDTATQARLWYLLGRLAFARGRYEEALEHGERASHLYAEQANREGEANAKLLLATTLVRLNRFHLALDHYSQVQQTFRTLDNRQGLAASLVNAGALALRSGDLARSAELNRQAIEVFAAIGDERGIAIGCINLGLTLVWQAQPSEAVAWCERGLAIAQHRQFPVQIAAALGNLATALANQGRLHEACSLFEETVARRKELGHADVSLAAACLALVYWQLGDLAAADRWSAEALQLVEAPGMQGAELGYRVYFGRAQVLRKLGRREESVVLLEQAQAGLQAMLARFSHQLDRERFATMLPFNRSLCEAIERDLWPDPPRLV